MNEKNRVEQNEELKYALFNNSIVHISEVISGLNAGQYQCPKCQSLLIAKKGDVRVHHFAHYNYEQCQGAPETALHKLAKEILLNEKMVAIPDIEDMEQRVFVEFDEVNQEVRVFNMVVDVLAVYGVNTLAIEIKVTHEVDLKKIESVKQHSIDMIEIDLSSFIHADLSRDELINAVLDTAPRYWIKTETKAEDNNMSNKVKAMGFISSYGYSKKYSRNFEKRRLYIMQPIEKNNSQNYTVSACAGYEMSEFELDDNWELHDKLERMSFPCDMVLTIGMTLRGKPVVTNAEVI